MANKWGNNGNSDNFIFLGFKITVDGDCSQEIKIMASGPITSWEIDGEAMETVTDFIVLIFKITAGGD